MHGALILQISLFLAVFCLLSPYSLCQPDPKISTASLQTEKALGDHVGIQENIIESSVSHVVWCGTFQEGKLLVQTVKGTLYRSEDHGKTLEKISTDLARIARATQPEKKIDGSVHSILKSEADGNLVIFLGNQGANWISEDCGKLNSLLQTEKNINEFRLHPRERTWLLGSAWTDSKSETERKQELFYSGDLGRSWTRLIDYVYDFEWGVARADFPEEIPRERIILARNKKAEGNQSLIEWSRDIDIIVSDDFFKTFSVLVLQGNKFMISSTFFFVARVIKESSQEVELTISPSKVQDYKFHGAELPFSLLEEFSYTILDTEENQVFLNVNHFNGKHDQTGSLYISDSHGIRYSTSLVNCVRTVEGSIDFDRVKGMEGVYLANVYDEQALRDFEEALGDLENEQRQKETKKALENSKKTLVSFEKGSKWEKIKPPEYGALGKQFECQEKECFLHLHLASSGEFARVYSTENSMGIIIGTGSIGSHLSYKEDQVNTFMSRDGGLHWHEIAKGSHFFEISDHGALIVMAQNLNPTNFILFTWNEGKTWGKLKITEDPIAIEGILAEPDNIGVKFLIYGATTGVNPKGIVIHLDFSELHERDCQGHDHPDSEDSDYETWTPHTYSNEKCLMGRKVQYIRRKRDAECLNGLSFDEKTYEEPCSCTDEDWECELGYYRSSSASPCLLTEVEFALNKTPPAKCKGTYTFGNGYRKVPGNHCIAGVNYLETLKCPWSFPFLDFLMILLPALAFLHFGRGLIARICFELSVLFDFAASWLGESDANEGLTESHRKSPRKYERIKEENSPENALFEEDGETV